MPIYIHTVSEHTHIYTKLVLHLANIYTYSFSNQPIKNIHIQYQISSSSCQITSPEAGGGGGGRSIQPRPKCLSISDGSEPESEEACRASPSPVGGDMPHRRAPRGATQQRGAGLEESTCFLEGRNHQADTSQNKTLSAAILVTARQVINRKKCKFARRQCKPRVAGSSF